MAETPLYQPDMAETLEAEAKAAGKTMAYEGFPRAVPAAYRAFAAAWLAGYDSAEPQAPPRQA